MLIDTLGKEEIVLIESTFFLFLFVYLLLLVVPGFIAEKIFSFICFCNNSNKLITALIFDLIIFIINITGLYYLKGLHTFEALEPYFNCLSFTRKYALLSILVGIILAVISGIICRIFICNTNRSSASKG
jgi:hypothetical protein